MPSSSGRNKAACRLWVATDVLAAGSLEIRGDDFHYLFHVRRLKAGDSLTLFDGAGREATATVQSVAAQCSTLVVDQPGPCAKRQGCHLIVAQALLKGERMDWCIQKLVELGVRAIIPLRTARTVVDVRGQRAEKRRQRFESIAVGAARQSRRAWLPEIEKITAVNELWPRRSEFDASIVLWEGDTETSLRAVLPSDPASRICLVVGPEGGFSGTEIEQARAAGFATAGLGPHILRAETAALAASAFIGLTLGDLA